MFPPLWFSCKQVHFIFIIIYSYLMKYNFPEKYPDHEVYIFSSSGTPSPDWTMIPMPMVQQQDLKKLIIY